MRQWVVQFLRITTVADTVSDSDRVSGSELYNSTSITTVEDTVSDSERVSDSEWYTFCVSSQVVDSVLKF